MDTPEHYEADVLSFFDGRPAELGLYQALFRRLEERYPEASVKVRKSQIGFYSPRLFAMVSLPRRKGDGGIVVSFGLGYRAQAPRIAAAPEPYPGRWTHHVPVRREEELDGELLGWIEGAYGFSLVKGRR